MLVGLIAGAIGLWRDAGHSNGGHDGKVAVVAKETTLTAGHKQPANQKLTNSEVSQIEQTNLKEVVFDKIKYQNSIVWLRGDVEGLELPWCSGWIMESGRIATTANGAFVLKEVVDRGGKCMIFSPKSETFHAVTGFEVHPVFSEQKLPPQSPASPNIAVISTDNLLGRSLQPIGASELNADIVGATIHVVGYELPASDEVIRDGFTPQTYSRFNAPKLIHKDGTITAATSGKFLRSDCPLLVTSIEGWPGCDGAAVFDAFGRMIGTLFKLESQERAVVVLNDYLAEVGTELLTNRSRGAVAD